MSVPTTAKYNVITAWRCIGDACRGHVCAAHGSCLHSCLRCSTTPPAKEDLEAGQLISHASTTIRLSALVLEGHRFAVAPIGLGELITSWGEPFGKALRPIAPGEWLRNTKVIAALLPRGLEPGFTPNFADYVKPAALSEASFVPGPPVPLHRLDATFYGFVRAPVSRGVGTRNSLSRLWRHVLPVRDEGRETPGLWSSKRVVHVCQLPPPTGPAAHCGRPGAPVSG